LSRVVFGDPYSQVTWYCACADAIFRL